MSKYNESPLGKIIADTLLKIKELRKKYPLHKNDSLEKKHADQIINAIETIFIKLHTNVFPKFDQNKKPGLVGIIKDLYGLKNLGEYFITRKGVLFQDIEKILPALIKEAVKQTQKSESVNDTIIKLLRKNKAKLIENSAKIPGTNLDELFAEIEGAIKNLKIAGNPNDVVDDIVDDLRDRLSEDTLDINHPMIFELAEAIAGFIEVAPKELKELVPFFNPEALEADLHNGIIGRLIGRFFGGTFFLENIKNGDSTPSFTYNLRRFFKEIEHEAVTFSGSELYNNYVGFIHAMFESEKARVDLLQKLVDGESGRVARFVTEHRQDTNKSNDYTQYKGKALISVLQFDLKTLANLAIENQKLVQFLEHRTSSLVKDLLMDHNSLMSKMIDDRDRKKLSVSYLENRLPESLVGSNKAGNIEIIPIRSALDSTIKAGLTDLREIKIQAEEKRRQLAVLLDNAIGEWKKETFEEHVKRIKILSEQLKHHQGTLGKITATNEPVASHNEVERLEGMIKNLEKKVQNSESLLQDITLLLSEISASTFPSDDTELDSDGSLRANQDKIIQPLIEATTKLIEDTELTRQKQQKEIDKLISQLEKSKADAELVKNFASANPEEVQELLHAAERKLKALQEKHAQLEECGKSLNLEHESKKLALIELQRTRENQSSILDEIRVRDDKLLDEVATFIAQHNLPSEQEKIQLSLFNENFLQNLADFTQKQMIILAEKQKYFVELKAHEYYKNLELIFNQVNELVDKNKEDSIPFKDIDRLLCLAGSESLKNLNGFNLLLNLIGLDKERDWNDYRSRQDDIFRFKPEKKEFFSARSLLLEKIKLAELVNKKNLAESECKKETLEGLNSAVLQWNNIKVQLQSNFEQKLEIQTKLMDRALLDNLHAETESLQQRLDGNNLEITHLAQETKKSQNTIKVLKTITEILEKAKDLNDKINTFGQKTSNFMTDQSLFISVSELKTLQNVLCIQVSNAEHEISELSDVEDCQAKFQLINQLLTETNKRLSHEIKEKFNEDHLNQLIDNNEKRLAKLNESQAKVNKMLTKESIQPLLDNYSNLSESVKNAHAYLSDLASQFSSIQDDFCCHEINTKLQSLKDLQNRSEQFGLNLADELITLFNAQGVQATLFNIRLPDESKQKQKENSEKLAKIRKFVEETLSDEEMLKFSQVTKMLVNSSKIGDKIQAVKQEKIKAFKQLELSDQANENLLTRIQERDGAMQSLIKQLDDYAKNKVSEERFEFINSLKGTIEAYQNSGDSSKLEKTINDNISRFPGIRLHGLLNKIKITVIDLNRKIPVDYYQPELQVSSEDLHEQALEVLQAAKGLVHIQRIQDLYERINSINVYGEMLKKEDETSGQITIDLANKLKNDVNRFVATHGNNPPSTDAYNKFKDEFSARLHSEDSEMSKHRNSFKPILVNVFIGLITVGIALGIKLIHSQITTKRYSLFFDKTERQKYISAIGESVNTIALPPSV